MSHPDLGPEVTTVEAESKPDIKTLFSAHSPGPRFERPPPTPPLSPKAEPTLGNEGEAEKPKPNLSRRQSKKKVPPPRSTATLMDHLPKAWDEAHETFETLDRCVYETKKMGLSREQDEMMVCDCVYDRHDPEAEPCGAQSDCINRAIFIECLADECRARTQCQNQRFMKKQYAPIDIVQTDMKGFGLRAEEDIQSGSLIYEYIGEVITEKTFRKRMQLYADEGIRHFYFMMLQKEEYIDATKKGGIGRFANHSCNPNSEVQKWVVGRRLRMGIFTKRDVVKGEEITFNYNVDRYGHDAQPCYCGESNCVGSIGGKTQTDVGTINDLFLEALGIADQVEQMEMKGSKKKKSRQLDEDFVPILNPIEEHEAQKVAAAMRQSMENKRMMNRLLQRVQMTDDGIVHRQLMRMHGFSLMSMVLTELAEDKEIVKLALEGMSKWKLQIKNKIEDANIEEPVRSLASHPEDEISGPAKQLLEYWSTLEHSYRIPRVSKIANLDAEDEAATTTIAEADIRSAEPRRPQAWENTAYIKLDVAPVRPRMPVVFSRPKPPPPPTPKSQSTSSSADRLKLDAILALAQQTVAAAAAVLPVTDSPAPSAAAESSRSGSRADEDRYERAEVDRRKRVKRSHNPEEEEAKKEKRLTKLVGDVVVRSMTKYKDQMEHDTFKRYAKECTMILVDKEKKGHSYTSTRHPSLSEDKKAKLKSFTKDYTHKVLKKLKEKGKLRKVNIPHTNGHGHSSTPSTSTPVTTVLETRDGSADLVSDIFGADDPDDIDLDLDMETEMEDDVLTTNPEPEPDPNSHSVIEIDSPLKSLKQAKVTERRMNGVYKVESLDMASFKIPIPHSTSGMLERLNGVEDTPDRTPRSEGA